MGIFKDTLAPFVHDQLYIRQSLAAFGNMQYGRALSDKDGNVIDPGNLDMNTMLGLQWGSRFNEYNIPIGTGVDQNDAEVQVTNTKGELKYVDFRSKDEFIKDAKARGSKTIPGQYWHSWMLNKSCTIRMASMVDLVSEDILDLDYEFNGVVLEKELLQYGLARNYMLEGGTLLNVEGQDTPLMREGFPKKGKLLGTAYGDPLSRSDGRNDAYGESYGIVPMPGITQVNIRTKSAYGSLREAKVEFVCHNLRQLSVMELLYMRPGYPVLLEWGWTPYITNEGELETDFEYISNKDRFWGRSGTSTQTMEQQEIVDTIMNKKSESSGNYDGLLGLCKNFSYTARDDGGFNCVTELIGVGEVLTTLKAKTTPVHITEGGQSQGGNVSNLELKKTMHLSSLEDFITQTYDYKLGGKNDDSNEDDDYITKQKPGDDNEYGTEDDPPEIRGDQANYSERYLEQPEVYDPWLGAEYKWRKNKPRSTVDQGYKKQYFDGSTFDGKKIFDDKYFLTFKEYAKGSWLSSVILRNPPLLIATIGLYAAGFTNIWNLFNEKERCISEGYIRLDALLFNINKHMIDNVPKSIVKGAKITAYQTLHYNPNSKEPYRMHTFNTYHEKIKNQWKALWLDDNWDKPTGRIGEYMDRSDETDILDCSINPYVCLMPNQCPDKFNNPDSGDAQKEFIKPIRNYIGYNSGDFKKDKAFDKSFKFEGNETKRMAEAKSSIGHIMVNIEHMIEIHFELFKKDKDYGIGQFLNRLLADINKSSGGSVNLSIVTDNEYSHIGNIIDLNKEEKSHFKDIFKFNVLSNDSAVKNFSFNTAIPTAMSSTIAVSAMNPDSAKNLDNVSFAALNRGISNRLYRNTPPDIKEQTEEEKKKLLYDMRKQMHELNVLLNQQKMYQMRLVSGNHFRRGNNQYMKKVSEMSGAMGRIYSLTDSISTKDKFGNIVQNPMSNTPIPINVDLELEGISGMVIGQMFRVNESRLPKHYRNKQIMFLIVNEDQNINADGTWTTKISGQMHLFPGEAKNLENKKYIEEKPVKKQKLNLQQAPKNASGGHYRTDCTGKTYRVKLTGNGYKVEQGWVPGPNGEGQVWSNGPDPSCQPFDGGDPTQKRLELKRKENGEPDFGPQVQYTDEEREEIWKIINETYGNNQSSE